MTGLLITTFNRSDLLEKCLESVRNAVIPEGTIICIVDDDSSDERVLILTRNFHIPGMEIHRLFNPKNRSVSYSLKEGYSHLFKRDCTTVINLDSDAIVKKDFIQVLTDLKSRFPQQIVTGFNSINKNRNGSDRHPVISKHEGYWLKSSVGGINMAVNKQIFEKYLLPTFNHVLSTGGNWDAIVCKEVMKDNLPIVVSVPSVCQHIGGNKSAMGHNFEEPDVACDFEEIVTPSVTGYNLKEVIDNQSNPEKPENPPFKPENIGLQLDSNVLNHKLLSLSSVTLLTVNCDKIDSGIEALETSQERIQFGAVKLLTSQDTTYPHAVKIPHIASKKAYSEFIMKKLDDYVDTEFVLIIQSDGYVKNPGAWSDEFLQYDYIGATWWHKDGHNVGNGGFSLRSKRLLHITKVDGFIRLLHPEDHHICRTYRGYLQRAYSVKFAPEEVAKRFSIEGYNQHDKAYRGQFGFHGNHIRFPTNEKLLIIPNQFFGLGDILFLIPLMRTYIAKGHKILWPVIKDYVPIQKHFPDITFIDKDLVKLDLERRDEYEVNGARVIPFRWAQNNANVPFRDTMKQKYISHGMDWRYWRNLTWERDLKAEEQLTRKMFSLYGIKPGQPYRLINKMFRSDNSGRATIPSLNGMASVEMKPEQGFTLIDWQGIMEGATEIHSVSTASLYMFELMDLKNPVHLYLRKPEEKNFDNVDYLTEKEYVFHR